MDDSSLTFPGPGDTGKAACLRAHRSERKEAPRAVIAGERQQPAFRNILVIPMRKASHKKRLPCHSRELYRVGVYPSPASAFCKSTDSEAWNAGGAQSQTVLTGDLLIPKSSEKKVADRRAGRVYLRGALIRLSATRPAPAITPTRLSG
jgi:hypothetical protein